MLEKIDVSKKIDKAEYKSILEDLEIRISVLQREARKLNIPIIIVFEGWDAAGKGTLINRLLLTLDPRGFTVYPTNAPNAEERLRPFLWRFWKSIPAKGRIVFYDRSWYGRVLVARVDRILKKKVWSKAYEEIKSFERQLADDGTVIIKFFLHISKKEQKKRFIKIEKNPSIAWKVTKEDWKHHKQYNKYFKATEEMLAQTDTDFGPWTVIESHDRKFAFIKVVKTIIDRLEKKINATAVIDKKEERKKEPVSILRNLSSTVQNKVDLSKTISKEEYEKELKKNQKRIREIEHEVFKKRIPVIIAYEGWDAAGKGGNIKRLVQGMDPRGYEVIPIAAPNDIEKAHHYLWRFWIKIPKAGHIAIFDRTWYGRVLVERVENLINETQWAKAYREINEMEEQLTNFGTVMIKFWLQIDKNEQLKRFQLREKTPYKKWKITDEDWRNRKKWDKYNAAVDEMLLRTSTTYAPWTIIEANCKWYARIKVLQTVIYSIEKKLQA